MKNIKLILILIGLFAMFYLSGATMCASWNLSKWDEKVRIPLFSVYLLIAIFAMFFNTISIDDKPKRL